MNTWIFGYGSLMNPKSLARTLPGPRRTLPRTLRDFQRIANVPVSGYAYLNVAEAPGRAVAGICIAISQKEWAALMEREPGYDAVDVSALLDAPVEGRAFAFMARQGTRSDLPVPRSYLETCLRGVPEERRMQWMEETVIPNGIVEDLASPVYENAALD